MSDDTTPGGPHPSGRFVLRIEPDLHGELRAAARAASLSLNEYCARKLASPGAPSDPEATAVVGRAGRILGESLIGVVAFGSWVRGENRAASDFDALLITGASVPITRELYRWWDREPALRWHGHQVAPLFVRLPPEGAVPSGMWAEAATDGLVLYERGWLVSERLAGIRRMIAAGRISRRLLHAQPYWVLRNAELAEDYLRRARLRLWALDVLFAGEGWPDVVREAQEIVELTLKGLLRRCGVDPPRVHDVSGILIAEKDRLPSGLAGKVGELAAASRLLRRDRELAFYGAEDLTPSGFYSRADAEAALAAARRTVEVVYPYVVEGED